MNSTNGSSEYICLSLWPLDMPKPHLITWAVLSAVLSPITIASNAALMYGLYKTKQLTSITNQFIIIMNISDVGMGIIVLPMMTAMVSLTETFRNCQFEFIMQFIYFLFAYFSFLMLMCVSLDRYIHVTKLNKYNQFMNPFRMRLLVFSSLVLSLIVAYVSYAFQSFWLQFGLNFVDLIGVSLMFLMYTMIFRKISIHIQRIHRTFENLESDQAKTRATNLEVSATKTVRLALGALLVLYLPYNICSVTWAYYRFNLNVFPPHQLNVATYWSYLIVLSDATVNAVLIGLGNTAVRRYLANKFRGVVQSSAESE